MVANWGVETTFALMWTELWKPPASEESTEMLQMCLPQVACTVTDCSGANGRASREWGNTEGTSHALNPVIWGPGELSPGPPGMEAAGTPVSLSVLVSEHLPSACPEPAPGVDAGGRTAD